MKINNESWQEGWQVAKQLFLEFLAPAIAAVIWVLVVYFETSPRPVWTTLLGTWGSTFVFVGLFTNNINRVRKNRQTASGLKTIESRIKDMIGDLDAKTQNLVGHITGGDSFCHLFLTDLSTGPRMRSGYISHTGDYNIPDVEVLITDLNGVSDVIRAAAVSGLLDQQRYNSYTQNYGKHMLRKGFAMPISVVLPDPVNGSIRLKIDFFTRGAQLLQMLFIDTTQVPWATATRVSNIGLGGASMVLREHVDPNFPRGADGQVDWRAFSDSRA
ncbi:hypothetical protein [Herbaspirillum sp. NPDC101396]|uniref:hypothetical protein n=1 Tax=Herbaspirillum sp. NPDC101396 TaxID=3364005 RepID=UPI00383A3A1F